MKNPKFSVVSIKSVATQNTAGLSFNGTNFSPLQHYEILHYNAHD
jgi:hypothetical protein